MRWCSKYKNFIHSLDFLTFTTAQPTSGTCTDTFQVGGASTVVPTICGDNAGQHSKSQNIYVVHFIFRFLKFL